jgi:CheY-specific phosphatase CheX
MDRISDELLNGSRVSDRLPPGARLPATGGAAMEEMEKWAAEALHEVLETMFYVTAEICEEHEARDVQYQGAVCFEGTHPGRLALRLSESLAHTLAANLHGARQDDFSPGQLGDVVKELTNMVAGSFLMLAESSLGPACLMVPDVVRIEPTTASRNSSVPCDLVFEVDGEILALEITVQQG